jgi:hypothetical protein
MMLVEKRIVANANMQPVAIQINYYDWLKIEQLLNLQDQTPSPRNKLAKHAGVIQLTEEPLVFQQRIRGEWS